ncbi:hypothetical protein Moror_1527 [Moniliophthora roreri MCA 2997]|uniref:Uncharacterized protein n=2 Tax=Moniliophthora roreri TaxID=221103 RepID=V2YPP0_MONRO|nr:hypothetical protein Moror_1527 [Moniliophthora roreri MCA 2997]
MSSYTAPQPPTEIITYRLNDEKLVYVTPLSDYTEAIQLAVKEFPEDLAGIPIHRIRLKVSATMGREKKYVRISESAWPSTVKRMVRGEVVDVEVAPEKGYLPPPPSYLEVPDELSSRRESKSMPPSRTSSPTPSDKTVGRSRSWFRLRT